MSKAKTALIACTVISILAVILLFQIPFEQKNEVRSHLRGHLLGESVPSKLNSKDLTYISPSVLDDLNRLVESFKESQHKPRTLNHKTVGLQRNQLISKFEVALEDLPRNIFLNNNLAVLLLDRWDDEQMGVDLIKAHWLLEQIATENLEEIFYNQALIYQELGLSGAAKNLLSELGSKGRGAIFARDLREHLEYRQLVPFRKCSLFSTNKKEPGSASLCTHYDHCVKTHPDQFRLAFLSCIFDWANRVQETEIDAVMTLPSKLLPLRSAQDLPDYLALDILRKITGNGSLDSQKNHPRNTAQENRKALIQVMPYFNTHSMNDIDPAISLLTDDLKPLKAYLLYRKAIQAFHNSDPRTLSILEESLRSIPFDRFQSMRGDILGLQATIHAKESQHQAAIDANSNALSIFEAAGEPMKMERIRFRLGSAYTSSGQLEEGFKHSFSAVLNRHKLDPNNQVLALHSLATNLRLRENWLLAKHFLEEALFLAQNTTTIYRVNLLRDLIQVCLALQLSNETTQLLTKMVKEANDISINDNLRRLSAIAEANRASAMAFAEQLPEKALSHLEQAKAYYEDTKYALVLAPIYLLEARINLSLGNEKAAERAFLKCLNQLNQRDASLTEFDKAPFYRVLRDPYYDVMSFSLFQRNDSHQALELFDQLQGRVSNDLLKNPANRDDLSLDILDSDLHNGAPWLPANSMCLVLAVVDGHLVRWLVEKDTLKTLEPAPIDEKALKSRIERLNREIQSGSNWQGVASTVYEQMFDNIPTERLLNNKQLFIVAGEWLQEIPFSSLRDPKTNQFLAEYAPVSRIPSLGMLRNLLARHGDAIDLGDAEQLFVANPAFSTKEFPRLMNLPNAEKEIDSACIGFSKPVTLYSREASREAIERLLPIVDLFHYAGHAVPNYDAPTLSKLLLTPSEINPTGEYFAYDWLTVDMPFLRMAVLSACQTGEGFLSPGEGISFFAQTFLVKGAFSVIVNRWNVGDADGRFFMEAFYQALKRGQDSLSAFQTAQLKCISSKEYNHPRAWAGFQFTGMGITFP